MSTDDSQTTPVLNFLGATGTVTGSKFVVESATAKVMVDAGLYQGTKELRQRNWAPLPVDPRSIDAVVLTHAHIDHCGYLPAFVRDGFAGPVYCSEHTAALAGIVLPDSGHLQEEEANYANRKGFSKHHPALPLYTEADARRSLESLTPLAFHDRHQVAADVTATLHPAGHILGSAIVNLEIGAGTGSRLIKFSGDLGRPQHPLLVPPHTMGEADVVLIESTYGNRSHDDAHAAEAFAAAINKTVKRGGIVVIPAFAVDRTEVVLHHLRELRLSGAIPEIPVYVDSPMALAALEVYRHAINTANMEIRPEVHHTDPFDTGNLHPVREVAESMELDRLRFPAIIISASGMATGGRVLHHLKRYLPDHRNTVILVGFQAQQTRGRQLADGARQVKLLGGYVPVRADIVDLPSFSVHADQDELLDWLAASEGTPPDTTYIVHGEPNSSAALQQAITDKLDWNAVVPTYLEKVRLD
jgi:metallo-beta-lactamase family protein